MGIKNRRQMRAALTFAAKLILFAITVTLLAKVVFPTPSGISEASAGVAVGAIHDESGAAEPPGAGDDIQSTLSSSLRTQGPDAVTVSISRALVIASTSNLQPHEVAWLEELPPEWQDSLYNYVTDRTLSAKLAVPVNKGNEAMVYMTYIIDHYDALPDVVLFHHAHRHSWHQAMDSIDEVHQLRVEYVQKEGYVSLRCLPGCENVIKLADYAVDQSQFPGHARAVQLTTLLNDFLDKQKGELVPVRLASPCCAQFAASREAIIRRPLAWWVSLRQWLIETPLPSMDSGRLMEYTWHIWLGSESNLCPDFAACQCHVYGIGQCEEYFAPEQSV